METSLFIAWLVFALIVAFIGKDKQIGFGMALLWAVLLSPVIGLIIVLISGSKSQANPDVYKTFIEAARRAQHKEKYEQAIDHYQDALYHLKNDYKTPNKDREALMVQISGIIAKLKKKLPEPHTAPDVI